MGFESMAAILELLYESNVECVSVYAFSIENFNRLETEVLWLMDLAKAKCRQMSQHGDLCDQFGIRIRILGNLDLLPPDVRRTLEETEEMTKSNSKATLNVCFPYTARDEIATAIRGSVLESVADPDVEFDEDLISKHLFTADSPPLEMLIRTSGTYRLSDFLLWQAVPSTCSVVFSPKMWPDFTPWDMAKILCNWCFNTYWYGAGYGQRQRPVRVVSHNSTSTLLDKEPPISLLDYADQTVTSGYERFQKELSEDRSSDSLFRSEDNDDTATPVASDGEYDIKKLERKELELH